MRERGTGCRGIAARGAVARDTSQAYAELGSAVTATQLQAVICRLAEAGHWRPGDPAIWVVMDAGYHAARLAWLLRDLPVRVLARMRSDRVLRRPAPAPLPGRRGRLVPRRGSEFVVGDPANWGEPDVKTTTETRLYGTATARAWHRLHPKLTRRAAWGGCPDLRILEAVIWLGVERAPIGAKA